MASFHKTDGTATIGGKGRNGRHSLTLVHPSELGQHCVTPGAHRRCRSLCREPGREDDRKAPMTWCGYLAEVVLVVDRRQVRLQECIDDFGCAG